MTAEGDTAGGEQVERGASRTITREELYQLVWSMPVRRLARSLGISDVGLIKMCRRLGVPRPNKTYWARVQRGQLPARAQLPPVSAGMPAATSIVRAAHSHHAVRLLREALVGRRPIDGLLVLPGEGGSVLRVSPAARERALRILDAFANALVARGHEVVARGPAHAAGSYTFEVVVAGRGIALSLHERSRRNARPLQPTLSGQLVLRVGGTAGGPRRSWSDGRRARLEDKLGQAVPGAEEVAADQLAEDHRWTAWWARYREAERQQAVAKLHADYGQALVRDLGEMAAAWRESHQLNLFLQAVDLSMPEDLRGPGFTAWMTWARGYVVQRDPLNWPDQIAKRLDPAVSALPDSPAEDE